MTLPKGQKRVYFLCFLKIENTTIPSLIKIYLELRFRLRCCGIKTIRMSKWRCYWNRVDAFLDGSWQAWEVKSFRKGSQLSSDYSPTWFHFSAMKEATIEEMCDWECVCTQVFLWFPILSPCHWTSFSVGSWVLSHFYLLVHWLSNNC